MGALGGQALSVEVAIACFVGYSLVAIAAGFFMGIRRAKIPS